MFEAIIFVWLLTAEETTRTGPHDFEIKYEELQPNSKACDDRLEEMYQKVIAEHPRASVSGLCTNRAYIKE